MRIATDIEIADSDLLEICRKYGVKELAVFGSAARGEMCPESDVDFLVEFREEARPGLIGLSALGREFSRVLGRRVDVAVKAALKPLVRNEILSEAHVIYAEGAGVSPVSATREWDRKQYKSKGVKSCKSKFKIRALKQESNDRSRRRARAALRKR